jgi:hypothetical protein
MQKVIYRDSRTGRLTTQQTAVSFEVKMQYNPELIQYKK